MPGSDDIIVEVAEVSVAFFAPDGFCDVTQLHNRLYHVGKGVDIDDEMHLRFLYAAVEMVPSASPESFQASSIHTNWIRRFHHGVSLTNIHV